MDLNDRKLVELENKIEKVRRRKIADYRNEKIEYIDVDNNINKLYIYNNNIIEARRGCGKTTLVLKALENNNETTVQCDCQLLRKESKEFIILEILLSMINSMKNEIKSENNINFCKKYEACTKGVIGYFKLKFNIVNKDDILRYENYVSFVKLLDDVEKNIKNIRDMPEIYKMNVASKEEHFEKKEKKRKLFFKSKLDISSDNKIALKYKEMSLQLNNNINLYKEGYNSFEYEDKIVKKTLQKDEHEIIIKKEDRVNSLKKIIVELLEGYKRESEKGVIIYLDDFYQISKSIHPFIIQYLHDIYKATRSNTFCFKLVTLPSSLKINYDDEVIFSIKDDFSSVYLDYDLSNLDRVQEHLVDIITALSPELEINSQDIKSLFTNDDTLKFLVIATGGIPRDFMTSFCEAVRISKRNSKVRIGKDQIYEVVKNLKSDKDNNIEIDSELPYDKIECAIDVINTEIVNEMKTNVILYPVEKAEQHEKLLRNLTNLRYLHLIKQKTTSERTKQECRAYLVDMTFYACGRISKNFEFCRFWEKDSASRLNNLRRSPVWSFSDDVISEILN